MKPLGCTLTALSPQEVDEILRAVVDGDRGVPGAEHLRWLLATCHDGVAWGGLGEGGVTLSSAAFPGVSPVPERSSLLELRLFGPTTELRLWRTGNGFDGCRIEGAQDEAPAASPAAPKRESWILVGSRAQEARDGFTLLSGDAGKRQVVPLEIVEGREDRDLPLRLHVCHHLERDAQTGAVRVALTRWTGLGRRTDTDER